MLNGELRLSLYLVFKHKLSKLMLQKRKCAERSLEGIKIRRRERKPPKNVKYSETKHTRNIQIVK
jgi:hypothetical protein